MSKYVNVDDLREVPISDFLARLGHHPVRRSGKELFYHSMLRETRQDTPSLTVWDEGGKWLDRGGPNVTGIQGGGIVQLGLAYWPQLSFVEVLNKIKETCDMQVAMIPAYKPVQLATEQEQKGYAFELVRTQPIGRKFVLTKYLEERGVLDVAHGHLHEIYYRNRLDNENKNTFYAIGWKNDQAGWEFTNAKGFKSSIGKKGISVVPGNPDHAVLFEGYMDYLSWLKVNRPDPAPTAIVLNSIVQLKNAIERVKNVPIVDVYFDNDDPGRNCAQRLIEAIPHAKDRSGVYGAYKDYNDMLRAVLNEQEIQHQRAGPGR
ncbi:toprim domain-containing protein [Sphingobacterium sp. UDSM-2020]|uniref:toprim domain-containing protein n=1 Tax=Sphingobacterium sp. UDSM-2020 TaxID=2795738 RepID=UPI001936FF46|nr:toprim domain-containing protein [Sphingobacterium sp. UDSM-2020]QQD14388.1 toprim domain-containing protein [Sphingobacterium sp. UDSM-2020]